MYRLGSPFRQRASRKAQQKRLGKRIASSPKIQTAGVGTELKLLFDRIGVAICNECADKAGQWNRAGVKWCRDNRQQLVTWLIEQHTKRKLDVAATAAKIAINEPFLSLRIGVLTARHPLTSVVEIGAGAIVDVAIDRAIEKRRELVINESIPAVIVTSPRPREIHVRTVEAAKRAGFAPLLASCEPGTDLEPLADVVAYPHSEKQGQWRNFIAALRYGLSLNVPYFLAMEDDVELCRGSMKLLTKLGWPSADCGCLQLYSAAPLHKYPVGRRFQLEPVNAYDLLGACAMVLRRSAAIALVESSETGWRGITNGVIEEPERKEAADTYVGEVLSDLGFGIWAHNPTLANHIGDVSTLGHPNNNVNRLPLNFPGIDANLDTIFSEELKSCV